MTAATSGLSVLLEDNYASVSPIAVKIKNNELVEVDPAQSLGNCNLLTRDNPITAPFLKRFISGMMSPIALSRRELVDDFNWYSSDYVSKNRLGRGVDDCLFSAVDLPGRRPFLELICLNRSSMNRLAFTPRDGHAVRTAHIAYSAIDRVDADTLLPDGHERSARSADPAVELQKVLQLALKGESEAQLCRSVGIDQAKLAHHLKTIYAEFGVVSLAELTQRWSKRRRLEN
jgi:hypothetical protein